MTPRLFTTNEIPALARLWHAGWHEAHAAHVPAALVADRTLDSFAARLPDMIDRTRVVGPAGAPLGLCAILGDEIDQVFVAPAARGTSAAAILLQDGEARLAASGVVIAHLFCIPQNRRAMAFYTRQGWTDSGLHAVPLPATAAIPALTVIRFEKGIRVNTLQV